MSSPALPSTLRRPAAVSQAKKRSTSSRRDVVQALGGRNHQRLQWPQVGVGQRRFGQQGRRAVDAAQALDVHRQRVQEDAGHGVACDLRQVGIGLVRMAAATGLLRAANAHDEQALRAQVDGWRQRRGLPHGAIAEPAAFAGRFDARGRKDKGNGRRGQQVRQRQAARHGHALRALPGLDGPRGVVKGEVLAAGVAGGADGQGLQMALLQHAGQALQGHQALQQFGQRRVVQQRARPRAAPACDGPAHRQHAQPLRPAADDAQRIGAVDLIGMEMLPDLGDDFHRRFKTVGVAGQCRCIDGAGRGAADHAEGVAHAGHRPQGAAADALQRTQHTDLVGGTGATAAEHQGSQGGFVNGGTPAAEPAHAAISLGCGRIVGRPAARRSVAGPAIQPRPRGCGAQARDAGPGASDEPSASGCITRPGRDRHT